MLLVYTDEAEGGTIDNMCLVMATADELSVSFAHCGYSYVFA